MLRFHIQRPQQHYNDTKRKGCKDNCRSHDGGDGSNIDVDLDDMRMSAVGEAMNQMMDLQQFVIYNA